jgi:hypothetical protein
MGQLGKQLGQVISFEIRDLGMNRICTLGRTSCFFGQGKIQMAFWGHVILTLKVLHRSILQTL